MRYSYILPGPGRLDHGSQSRSLDLTHAVLVLVISPSGQARRGHRGKAESKLAQPGKIMEITTS